MAINKRDKGEIFSSWLWFRFGWWFWEDEDDEWDGRGKDKWDKQMVGWIIDKSKGISHYIFYYKRKRIIIRLWDIFFSHQTISIKKSSSILLV